MIRLQLAAIFYPPPTLTASLIVFQPMRGERKAYKYIYPFSKKYLRDCYYKKNPRTRKSAIYFQKPNTDIEIALSVYFIR